MVWFNELDKYLDNDIVAGSVGKKHRRKLKHSMKNLARSSSEICNNNIPGGSDLVNECESSDTGKEII